MNKHFTRNLLKAVSALAVASDTALQVPRNENTEMFYPCLAEIDNLIDNLRDVLKAECEEELAREAGISIEEINTAIAAHDFSSADPKINFWVNRIVWMRDCQSQTSGAPEHTATPEEFEQWKEYAKKAHKELRGEK